MDDFEKLVNDIMTECEKDGEPVTREEAEEMARMETGFNNSKKYEVSEKKTKTKKKKERVIDNEKLVILQALQKTLEELGYTSEIEKEIAIHFNGYSLKLIRHRPPKKK